MQPVRIIGERNGRGWAGVLDAVRESRAAGFRVLLYVPEQMTLLAERKLIRDLALPGLLDIDVISPRKLKQTAAEKAGSGSVRVLDEFGRDMAIRQVLKDRESRLGYYRNVTDLPGAVQRISQALTELRESRLSDEELEAYAETEANSAERARLADLKIIREGLEELLDGRFEEEYSAWSRAVAGMEKRRVWADAALLVYGFDTVRPDLREMLVHAAGSAGPVFVFLTMDREDAPDGPLFEEQRRSVTELAEALKETGHRYELRYPGSGRPEADPVLDHLERNLFAAMPRPREGGTGDALRLYSAADPAAESEAIAAALLRWHREGIPWNRMAAAVPPGSPLAGNLRNSLSLNGIPYTENRKESAAGHGIFRLLLGALRWTGGGRRTEDLWIAADSGFSSLTEEEKEKLENYARGHGIDHDRWLVPFTRGEDAGEAERLRVRLLTPIREMAEQLKAAKNAAASVQALVDFLNREDAYRKLEARQDRLLKAKMYREAVIDRQAWKKLMDLLDQLYALLAGRKVSALELARMLESAMTRMTLSALPEKESGVVLGEAGHILPDAPEALALGGMEDGVTAVAAPGWLTDPERHRMERATGRTIGLDRERMTRLKQNDYYRTLTLPTRHLLVSWSLKGEDGSARSADGLTDRIRELFPGLQAEGGLTGSAESAPETAQAAIEGMGQRLKEAAEKGEAQLDEAWRKAIATLRWDPAYARVANRIIAETAAGERTAERIDPETARRLFLPEQVSVSRLEQYARCPYRHFIDYGLRPVRQEEFEFRSQDAGNFFHEALDRYMRRAGEESRWPDLEEADTDRIMDGILAELTAEWEQGPLRSDALGEWDGEDYLRRARRAARVLTRFAANSDFRTIATEQSFGTPEGLPPVLLKLRDGSTTAIRGQIDRIDTYENGEGVWLRIIDNKSSGKQLDASRMASGEQLQLMIYLKAATEGMPGVRPAGALYFPVVDPEVDCPDGDGEQTEKKRLEKVRMKGVVAADPDVIRAMDRDVSPLSVDKVFNQDGSVSKSAGWAVEEDVLAGLMDAAADRAAELCSDIREGDIRVAPLEDGNRSPCAWCEYRAVCRVRKQDARSPEKGRTFRDAAGKKTLHETEK